MSTLVIIVLVCCWNWIDLKTSNVWEKKICFNLPNKWVTSGRNMDWDSLNLSRRPYFPLIRGMFVFRSGLRFSFRELCQNQRRGTTSPTASPSSSSLPSIYEPLPSPPRSTTLTQVSPPEKYQLVLVSSDCSEDGLGEHPSLVAHLYDV